jgi:histidinol dehydrogenase
LIYNAGAVYLGDYTPVPSADYFIGTNHVLPTGNSARFGSVLSVFDFMRVMSVAKMDKEDYMNNRKLGIRLAVIENMPQHKKSMEVRK